ncbi:SLAM family member 5-like isoform X4 [Xyrauchen texanus]|uniref:SLAM family member 5-like isoform X4 n=1 Tax=Xyrauchen texanus TaxID=154827 RepID=UPI0022420C6F|nr:SLAM family member 5-like isoform X4 [Xyrauchen texanus]
MSCLSETVKKMLDVTFCLCFWSLFGVFGVETDVSVSVMEGDSVTLKNNDTQILRDEGIQWRFGEFLIAEINRDDNKIKLFEDVSDGRFRGRIQLDHQTGSLIITNTRSTDSGQYKLKTESKVTVLKIFTLTVYARLPVPVIIRDSSLYSSSSKCVLVCSVVNVTQATLSWYKGNSLLNNINASNITTDLSLHLEVEYQENNTYSCVINNPIRNQTKHLNITEVCQTCPDNTDKDVRLIKLISAAAGTLLFVLIIAVVIFCICRKCRKTDQEVQTREEEITYADPAFYKRKTTKSKVKEEDDVVYAGVAVRR